MKSPRFVTSTFFTKNAQFKEKTYAIVTHVYATGPSFKLEEYLINNKVENLIIIGHPFSFTPDTRSFYRIYSQGILLLEKKFIPWRGPDVLFYIKDVFLTFWWILAYKKVDYFFGVDNLNAFTGFLLKTLHRINNIIYYTIDYVPNRFPNSIINSMYHFLDRFMIAKSNTVWNLSKIMIDEREKKGIPKKYRSKQIIVPIGTDMVPINRLSIKRKRQTFVFMGHLRKGHGIEMLIEVMTDVIATVPNAHLLIIGGGPLEYELKETVRNRKLEKFITFTGFVERFNHIQNFLLSCSFAVAPYEDNSTTYTRYTDPGKVKDYLACGLPVIITKVPQVAYEIDKNHCGIAIPYNKQFLTKAILQLLTDTDLLLKYQKNAIIMAKKYTWDSIYNAAFNQIL